MDEYSDPTPIATPAEFAAALKKVRDRFKKDKPFSVSPERELLRAHYQAEGHTITTMGLAIAVDLASPGAANLKYGKFAHLIADALGYKPGPFPGSSNAHWWRTLANGQAEIPMTEDGKYPWVLRPELCEALVSLGWFQTQPRA